MEKSCLQTALWSLVKNSSQQKHLPSFRHWAIFVGVSLMAFGVVLLTEADADDAGAAAGVGAGEDDADLTEERLSA
jgi:hypothetical protein